jgi:hypothetical protein
MSVKRLKAYLTNKGCLKLAVSALIMLVTPFYGVFAFYLLWNWFMADVIHASISYWQAMGLLLLVNVVSRFLSYGLEKEDRWMGTRVVIEACVPEEKKPSIVKAIKDLEARNVLLGADTKRLVVFTIAILIGLVIHVLFSWNSA